MSNPEIVEDFEDENTQTTIDDPHFVTELGEFIPLLENWHARQVKTVEHFFTVPEGQVVEVEGEPEFTLADDTLKSFKLGLSIALSYLGQLPFNAALEEVPENIH